jgi:RNA polymerase sigma factor (TIGR02999 family)
VAQAPALKNASSVIALEIGIEEIRIEFLPSRCQAEWESKVRHGVVIFLAENAMTPSGPSEVTVLLRAWRDGDQTAFDRLASLVYDDLVRMARHHMKNERAGHTLQTTALVNEAYLRLVDVKNDGWRDRAQFFALSAQVMRRILVDAARARGSDKRDAGLSRVNVDDVAVVSPEPDPSILALHEALEEFSKVAPRQAKVVELRYFGGLSVEDISEVMKISTRTVDRDWEFAKAWLKREINGQRL